MHFLSLDISPFVSKLWSSNLCIEKNPQMNQSHFLHLNCQFTTAHEQIGKKRRFSPPNCTSNWSPLWSKRIGMPRLTVHLLTSGAYALKLHTLNLNAGRLRQLNCVQRRPHEKLQNKVKVSTANLQLANVIWQFNLSYIPGDPHTCINALGNSPLWKEYHITRARRMDFLPNAFIRLLFCMAPRLLFPLSPQHLVPGLFRR